jgi:hypothetical protein
MKIAGRQELRELLHLDPQSLYLSNHSFVEEFSLSTDAKELY